MNKTCNSHILLALSYYWPLIFWVSRLWWDKTKKISSMRVKVLVSLTCKISKKCYCINPLLSTNIITKVICSLLNSYWASLTIKQNVAYQSHGELKTEHL
jgi:hypothetical protein